MNNNLIVGVLVMIVIFSLLFIGIYVNGNIQHTLEGQLDETEDFNVADPSVNKVCTLDHVPLSSPFTVKYHNGTGWKTLSSSDYTRNGQIITVKASAMD